MKKRLGILEEVTYSYKLMQRLNKSKKSSFLAYSFSEKESVEEFLENDTLDVLMVGQDYFDESLNSLKIGRIVVLLEEKPDYNKENCIYKYQAASDILSQLKGFLNMAVCQGGQCEMPVKIIGFYSPVRRCGKTHLAKSLAKKMAKKTDVLYLNLEPFASAINNDEEKLSLSDIFYYLEQGKLEEGVFERAVISSGEYKQILPIDSPVDLLGVKAESWNEFFMKINDKKIAEVVIVDFAECVSCFLQLFELCEKVYMPVLEEKSSVDKVKCFEEFLHKSVSDEVKSKIYKLQIPVLGAKEISVGDRITERLLQEIAVNG